MPAHWSSLGKRPHATSRFRAGEKQPKETNKKTTCGQIHWNIVSVMPIWEYQKKKVSRVKTSLKKRTLAWLTLLTAQCYNIAGDLLFSQLMEDGQNFNNRRRSPENLTMKSRGEKNGGSCEINFSTSTDKCLRAKTCSSSHRASVNPSNRK